MSAAVKEAPVKSVVEFESVPVEWKMPPISIGDNVVWYADGDRSVGPSAAKVVHVSMRSVDLRVEGRDISFSKADVRHVDDPGLKFNENLRRYGGWDYTAQYRDLVRRLEKLEQALV